MINRFLLALVSAYLVTFYAPGSFGADPTSDAMCRDEVSFRQCYGISKEKCLQWADQAVQACLNIMPTSPLPPASYQALFDSEFGKWNLTLGYCSEVKFDEFHKRDFKFEGACVSMRAQRQKNKQNENFKRLVRDKSVLFMFSQIMFFPMLLGGLGSFFFLRKYSKVKKPSNIFGFLSWVLFVLLAVVGEGLTHAVFPELFIGVGDEPGQVIGFVLTFIVSIPLNYVFWLYFRLGKRFKKTQQTQVV